MEKLTNEEIARIAAKFGDVIPGLRDHLAANIEKEFGGAEGLEPVRRNFEAFKAIREEKGELASERVVVARAGARPVVRIRNNELTTEFLGKNTANSPWATVLADASAAVNKALPAVGRIELTNGEQEWVGTGWLIDEGILVTNAHVAEAFSQLDPATSAFVFKPGFNGGTVGSQIDFLEEEGNTAKAEHPIPSVLWIAKPGDPDVAFLKVVAGTDAPLPKPVELGENIDPDSAIAAIGYPARDETVRDRAIVLSIFGDDVYEKKRLAPGKIMLLDGDRLQHDCSTLGGNSGSLLIDLKSGKAVGLHQGGFLDDSANLGVTVTHLKELLSKIKNTPSVASSTATVPVTIHPPNQNAMANANEPAEIRLQIQIPLEVTIRMGQVTAVVVGGAAAAPQMPASLETALEAAKQTLSPMPGVINIRKGYRFKNGWITDEQVIVVEVSEKKDQQDLVAAGQKALPREIMGIGIDVRTAALPDQLDALGIDLTVMERVARPAKYVEPDGFDDPSSDMFLGRVREKMDAVFHVSPDAGFRNLKAFFSRVQHHLTATIYEWDHKKADYLSDALEEAMQGNKTLKMVTQRNGVGGSDATLSAVEDMKGRIGEKFLHVWASTRGPNRLIPDSYHIKVASRDGEEFWLSSGNWKDSNQPLDPKGFAQLKETNREWHAVIRNSKLADLFRRYIDYDFEMAQRFPLEIKESPGLAEIELFVPDDDIQSERLVQITYDDELQLTDTLLDIQPLLTPDRDAEGNRLFLKHATDMIRRATASVYIQNQSFNMTEENNAELDEFFEVVRRKQRSIGDVRIIFRDAQDYGRAKDRENQEQLLERLKAFGLDTSPKRMRLQQKCHTKGIIVDSREVLLGSQNITNGGALFNRDASLLVRNEKVAQFFERIFLFDWEHLAHNKAGERTAGVRRARPNEETPEGFRRTTISDLLSERQ